MSVCSGTRAGVRSRAAAALAASRAIGKPAAIPSSWIEQLGRPQPARVDFNIPITPIHQWNIPGLEEAVSGTTLSIKRDDLTGSLLGGNKIRKLEYG
jgi:hypothetical protein